MNSSFPRQITLRRHGAVGSSAQYNQDDSWTQRVALGSCLLGALAAASLALSQPAYAASPAFAASPFLSSTGAKGPLAEEEERLFKLRQKAETEVQNELNRARTELEAEGRLTQMGKLCATPFGVDVVGITEFIALTGALVGGFTSRQRKEEVEQLNEQLRKINMSLRQQARAGTTYAPGLTYMPPSGTQAVMDAPAQAVDLQAVDLQAAMLPTLERQASGGLTVAESNALAIQQAASAAQQAGAGMSAGASMMASMDEEEMSDEAKQCLTALREGKRMLKERNGSSAMVRFEKALMLARFTGSRVQERRAVRGLAAAARLQGQYKAAIKHLHRVLKISQEMGDFVGDADAFGTIADIYTDMGELEKAGEYYDKYISRMNTDGPV
ncbi:hypothetical protein WJX72_010010 [[Myrmecia] bisecta]|uniref:Uncharacterized protein n=1 Tax=[Myrmecia] bisecta TaxID=41462 RepID=A0AAW1QG30_9CHLO